jgi:DNA-binding protein H-NS
MDITNLSSAELRDLIQRCEGQLKKREKQEREQTVEQIYSIAHSLGIPLTTLLKEGRAARKPSAAPSKQYRDPAHPENRWIGRGPRPEWLKKAIASGK